MEIEPWATARGGGAWDSQVEVEGGAPWGRPIRGKVAAAAGDREGWGLLAVGKNRCRGSLPATEKAGRREKLPEAGKEERTGDPAGGVDLPAAEKVRSGR